MNTSDRIDTKDILDQLDVLNRRLNTVEMELHWGLKFLPQLAQLIYSLTTTMPRAKEDQAKVLARRLASEFLTLINQRLAQEENRKGA